MNLLIEETDQSPILVEVTPAYFGYIERNINFEFGEGKLKLLQIEAVFVLVSRMVYYTILKDGVGDIVVYNSTVDLPISQLFYGF